MAGRGNSNLYCHPDLARFYDLGGWPRPDFDFCTTMAKSATSVLDLGCGTGVLAASLAAGRTVFGIDPAKAMLDIARLRPGGGDVTWAEADARSVRIDRHFDLVVLTGHTFQVFLEDEDQAAVLATISDHLAPNGRFIFDSRNPACPARKIRTRQETLRQISHADLGRFEAWNVSTYDEATGILSYENSYRALRAETVFSAPAQIRYTARDALAGMVEAAGLRVDRWLGDWQGRPFEDEAPEIIPIGRLA